MRKCVNAPKLCVNPICPQADDPRNGSRDRCLHCHSPLEFGTGFWATRLLQEDDFSKFYEVENDRGQQRVLQMLSLDSPRAIALLQQQARVLASLNHPGLPKVEGEGYFSLPLPESEETLHGLLMEKMTGISLEDWFQHQNRQPISSALALDWLEQLAELLHLLHHNLYFHRDIRPANILLRADGRLGLVNFGGIRDTAMAYLAFARQSLVARGNSVETLPASAREYTPEEQVRGKGVPQSDFFALGRTFVYLLTGQTPADFSTEPTTGKLLWRQRAEAVSPELATLIDAMIAPHPGHRPHNAAALLRQIQRVTSGKPSFWEGFEMKPEPPQSRYPQGSGRRTRKHRRGVLLFGGGSLLLLGAIAFYWGGPRVFNPSPPSLKIDQQR